jgi:hypothetical protein
MTQIGSARAILALALLVAMPASTVAASGQTDARFVTPVPATPQNAASFIGEWTITTSAAPLVLRVKVIDGTVVGEVTIQTGTYPATLKIAGASLLAGYDFDDQGVSTDAVLTITPNDKRVDAHVDFANGAPRITGTATKKGTA